MAKEKHEYDIGAGLSLGRRKEENEQTEVRASGNELKKEQAPVKPAESVPAVQPEPAVESAPAPAAASSFAGLYASQANFVVEPRNVRIQMVVTQTTAQKLDKLVQDGKIRSKNDLMNFLLEGYLGSIQ